MTVRLDIVEADPLVCEAATGVVAAGGSGWLWVRGETGSTHVCGPRGPRGPRTAVMRDVPALAPGTAVRLDVTDARPTPLQRLPPAAGASEISSACALAAPFGWLDVPCDRVDDDRLVDLLGHGPGLTPAGDDVVCGYLAARFALHAPTAQAAADLVLGRLDRTGEPSASLIRAAATTGRTFAAAMTLLAALIAADRAGVAAGVRAVAGLGQSTGRALITGMVDGVRSSIV